MRILRFLVFLFFATPQYAMALDDAFAMPILRAYTSKAEPGAAILVLHKGEEVLKEAYGMADPPQRRPLTSATPFVSASLAKPMTDLLLARLVAEGKLRLEARVSDFIKGFPFRDVTVEQLATHTSDVPALTPELCGNSNLTSEDIVGSFRSSPQAKDQPARPFFEYSNAGYAALSVVLARAAGKPFFKAMDERVFKPLGMHDTSFIHRGFFLPVNRARPFLVEQNTYTDEHGCGMAVGFGGMYTTLDDLELWAKAMRRGLAAGDKAIASLFVPRVSGSPGASAATPLDVGLGWFMTHEDGDVLFTAAGKLPGINHLISYSPSLDLWIVQLSNRDDYRAAEIDYFLRRAVRQQAHGTETF